MPDRIRRRTAIAAGGIAGLAAGLGFATLHALIIVPIWGRMLGGLSIAIVAGLVIGYAFGELEPDARAGVRSGVRFGALLWLSVVPVTLVDVVLRTTALARRFEMLEVIVAIALAVIGGALLGRWRVGTRRAMLAGSAAAVMLTIAMAGPVPVANSPRAVRIFVATLVVSLVGGLVLGLATRLLGRSSLLETRSSLDQRQSHSAPLS